MTDVEKAFAEHAKQAAEHGHAQVTAPVEPPVDFATLLWIATDPKREWPKAVQAWADKAPQNQSMLREAKGAGTMSGLLLRLIDEVLKAVNG